MRYRLATVSFFLLMLSHSFAWSEDDHNLYLKNALVGSWTWDANKMVFESGNRGVLHQNGEKCIEFSYTLIGDVLTVVPYKYGCTYNPLSYPVSSYHISIINNDLTMRHVESSYESYWEKFLGRNLSPSQITDYSIAIKELSSLAEQGNATAQFKLGEKYRNSNVIPRDYAQAVLWYRKAADQGHARAQLQLGIAYRHGYGVPVDVAQAISWYKKSADQGNVAAKVELDLIRLEQQALQSTIGQNNKAASIPNTTSANRANKSSGASDNGPMPPWESQEYADVKKVIVQVCVPNQIVAFEDVEIDLSQIPESKTFDEVRDAQGISRSGADNQLSPSSIQGNKDVVRRWIVGAGTEDIKRYFINLEDVLNQDGILSAGSGAVYIFGSTIKNQPVFEREGKRQKDYIALGASVDVAKNGQSDFVTYWFKLPTNIPVGEFSNWQEPISQEDKMIRNTQKNATFWNLTHGREMEIHSVGENAPKMRFKLMSARDYYNEKRFWLRSQKAVAEKYYRPVVGKPERENIYFVPKTNNTIPGC